MKANPLLFFDAVFIINLPHRTDRLKRFEQQCDKINFTHPNMSVFPAVNGYELKNDQWDKSLGALGCLESHLEVLRRSKASGYQRVMIFEDDFNFHPKFFSILSQGLGELPESWDMLYMYSEHFEKPIRFSKTLDRMTSTLCTAAYAVNAKIIDELIEKIERRDREVDVIYGSLHRALQCYSFRKNICITYEDYSDILQTVATGYKPPMWYRLNKLKKMTSGFFKSISSRITALVR